MKCEERNGVLFINASPKKTSELITILVQNGCAVDAIIPKTSLEDIYLSKTGTNGN